MKVVFATPTLTRPHDAYLASMEASVPLIKAAGWDEGSVYEIGCPYISGARATMLRKALDAKADVIVFLDYDLSWRPQDLLTLIETPGDVVAGTYRYKKPEEEYMGGWHTDAVGHPLVVNGLIKGHRVPAGFLKITKEAVARFMGAYPELIYGCGGDGNCSVDLFNHGAHKGTWWGEDMAFSRNWTDAGGEIWIVPDLDITHHSPTEAFPGNLHRWLLRLPGGSEAPAQLRAAE